MLCWARVKVLDNIIGFSFQQVMVTVFNKVFFDLFAADVALIFAIDPTECRIWLELFQTAQ